MAFATERLPADLLARATLHGREYAWPIDDIPIVIERARELGFVNIGGQLQFRTPTATCEIHYVEVNTFHRAPKALSWSERVERSAQVALEEFEDLRRTHDFVSELRQGFDHVISAYEAEGGNPEDGVCFVWYVESSN